MKTTFPQGELPYSDWVTYISNESRGLEAKNVLNTVSEVLGISVEDMSKRGNQVANVEARYIYFHFARKLKSTLKKIGANVNRDHSTVVHGMAKFLEYERYDKNFKNKVKQVKTKLDEKEIN